MNAFELYSRHFSWQILFSHGLFLPQRTRQVAKQKINAGIAKAAVAAERLATTCLLLNDFIFCICWQ
jgi:hypothetical protein